MIRPPNRTPAAPPEADEMIQAETADARHDPTTVPLFRPPLEETPSERIARKYGRKDPDAPAPTGKPGALGSLSARDKKLLVIAGALFVVAGGVMVGDKLKSRPSGVTITAPGMPTAGGVPAGGVPPLSPGVTVTPGAPVPGSALPPAGGPPTPGTVTAPAPTGMPGAGRPAGVQAPAGTALTPTAPAGQDPAVGTGALPGTRAVNPPNATPQPTAANSGIPRAPAPGLGGRATQATKPTVSKAPRQPAIPDVFRTTPKTSAAAAASPQATAVTAAPVAVAPAQAAPIPASVPVTPLPAPAPVAVPAPIRVPVPTRPAAPVSRPQPTAVTPITVTPVPVTITPVRPPVAAPVTAATPVTPPAATPGVVFTAPSAAAESPDLAVLAVTTSGIPTVTLRTPEGETTLNKGDQVPGTDATVTSITEKKVVLTSRTDLRPITLTVETMR